MMNRSGLLAALGFLALVLLHNSAFAHGGVVEEEDLCVIKVNYLRGHFKIYQPRTDGHKEYCEDLPNATESVFVMEYLHDSLGEAAVDFRIIHDVTGKGRFARWEDVAEIDDIQAATVFYRKPTVDPDVFSVVHDFAAEGDYIGIVTANVDGDEKIYRAVFPFEVGYTGTGYWPYIIGLLVIIQVQYFLMSGRVKRWRERRKSRKANPGVAMLFLLVPWLWAAEAVAGTDWVSDRGVYTVAYESSLQPIEINQIHNWILHISSDGEPVANAEVTISGGMPVHNHGLPTSPRVTEELGNGDYRLEGMRFHMKGDWEVSITIRAGGKTDTVIVTLTL